MGLDDYQIIRVQTGTYRLIPEDELGRILEQLAVLEMLSIPNHKDIDLPYLVTFYRSLKNLSQNKLGDEADIDRRQIAALEDGRNPDAHDKTIEKLCTYFGEGFRGALSKIQKDRK